MAFLFCLTSSIANAQSFQTTKPVICDKPQVILKALIEVYNEKPMWTAKDGNNDSRYSLFVNEETKDWTLVQMTANIACIIGVGEKSKFYLGTSV